MGGLDGDEEDDVVLSEGVPLVPHLHAVEVRQVERDLGQHLGDRGEGGHRQKGYGKLTRAKEKGKGHGKR